MERECKDSQDERKQELKRKISLLLIKQNKYSEALVELSELEVLPATR